MDDRTGPAAIPWWRALLTAVVIMLVGFVLLAWLPNYLLTHLDSLSRSARVTVVTTEFFVVLFVMAWALRRLQARHRI